MKLKEIYSVLDSVSPFELQEKWDNSGLIIGDMNRDIDKIVISIDLDDMMIESYEEGTLFILHHPLIFGKLTAIDTSKYPSNMIEKLILKRQSVIAMHTNFDKTHLNRYVFTKVLGLTPDVEKDFICESDVDWSLKELSERLEDIFGLKYLKMVNPKERIKRVALTTGAGASLMDMVDADCFLTGDIKYHDAMKALSQDLMMVDIGHWESESFFCDALSAELKNLSVSAIITQSKNPFTMLFHG